jgi:putative membrane protein
MNADTKPAKHIPKLNPLIRGGFIMFNKTICCVSGILWLCGSALAADSSFLKDAAQGGLMEVKLGELAQTNASSQAVKDFGQRMVTDHGKMGDEVKNVASRQNVSLPTDVSMMEKMTYERLSHKTGVDFDKAYIEDMVKDHKSDIAAFEKEVNSGSDPEAKAVAQKALPIIREHLRMAQQIAGQLGVAQ